MSDYTFKIIVVGASGVGKTAVVQRYVRKSFKEHDTSTIGVDIGIKLIQIDNSKIQVIITFSSAFCNYSGNIQFFKLLFFFI